MPQVLLVIPGRACFLPNSSLFSKFIENYVTLQHKSSGNMKVIIVGGGFGGLRLARKLNNKPGFEITLLDRFNFHQFQPLFYQVATAGLDASNISFPLRKAFHKSKNVQVRLGELREIKPANNKIITDNG